MYMYIYIYIYIHIHIYTYIQVSSELRDPEWPLSVPRSWISQGLIQA